jgi:hypothetical protein
MNFSSMSVASATPPLTAASPAARIIAPASTKSKKPSTCGKPGSLTALVAVPEYAASRTLGSTITGAR